MDRVKKLALIQRSLGLRHKLKVHESLKAPDTHDELSIMMMAKWELEDELRAIEEILANDRSRNVATKRQTIEKEDVGPPEGDKPLDMGRSLKQGKKQKTL
jgi:hypothetical protein